MALVLVLLFLEVSHDGRPVASLAQCPVDEPFCSFDPVFTAKVVEIPHLLDRMNNWDVWPTGRPRGEQRIVRDVADEKRGLAPGHRRYEQAGLEVEQCLGVNDCERRRSPRSDEVRRQVGAYCHPDILSVSSVDHLADLLIHRIEAVEGGL